MCAEKKRHLRGLHGILGFGTHVLAKKQKCENRYTSSSKNARLFFRSKLCAEKVVFGKTKNTFRAKWDTFFSMEKQKVQN